MRWIAFFFAISVSLLLNQALPPSVTMTNQLAAIVGWGLLLLVPAPLATRPALRVLSPLLLALALIAVECALSMATGRLPSSPGVAELGLIGLAACVALHGASAGQRQAMRFFVPFAGVLAATGVASAVVAVVQIVAYPHIDSVFVAMPVGAGRAAGNIGQANQFADTIVWGLLALVPLAQRLNDGRPHARIMLVAIAFMAMFDLLGIVLTGSRTGMVALLMLAAWGVFDRSLARHTRIALASCPAIAVLMLWPVHAWLSALGAELSSLGRDAGGATAYRTDIWRDALVMIREQPWFGAGWGELNFEWTLTPFANREMGFVDNAHNLPLHLAVEIGLPAALLVSGLLIWALVSAFRRTGRLAGTTGISARAALVMVSVLGLHSMLEYPLWYAYLLLPTAWAWGFATGAGAGDASEASPSPSAPATIAPWRAWHVLGLLMVVVGASAWLDYLNIVSLYQPTLNALPFEERIRHAQDSPLFAYHGDYVAVTGLPPTQATLPAVERSAHAYLNARLLYVWANQLEQHGQVDKARYLAARLREFNLPGPRAWFAPCDDPAVAAKPFQCLPPDKPLTWRDFR